MEQDHHSAEYLAEDRRPTLLGVFWVLAALATACTTARLYTRLRLVKSPGWDDALIVLIHLCLLTYTCTLGLGKHEVTIPLEQIPKVIKWIFINGPWGIMGVAIPKLAVVIFLSRIVGPTKRKQIWALYFMVITLIILSFVAAVLLFAQCDPPNHAWHPTEEAECWNPNVVADYSLFVGSYSAFNDLVLAIYPSLIVYSLQMSTARKVSLSLIMGLGVFACVCAIIRTTKLASIKTFEDYTWTAGANIIWTAAEMNVIIICACAPALLPLVQQLTGRKDYRSKPSPPGTMKLEGMDNTHRPLRDGISLGNMTGSHGTVNNTAFTDSKSESSVPEGQIKTSKDTYAHWEAV
ncbi:MAG: hypothetical protein Q9188_002997 [Gyalolechia gomerana]